MKIKHMPSGLFPHFDSGIERRPLYPEAGDTVKLGCRLEDGLPDTEVRLEWKMNGTEMPVLQGECTGQNDRGQSYYTFTLCMPESLAQIEYSFLAEDKSGTGRSPEFRFEILRAIELGEPAAVAAKDNGIYVLYKAEDRCFVLELQIKNSIRIFFNDHLTDKVTEFKGFTDREYRLADGYVLRLEAPFRLLIQKDGRTAVRYEPVFRLWTDRRNEVYQLEHSLKMAASAFYGFGERFDGVNQTGKSPLSFVVEQYADQQDKTYLPIPFFFTDNNTGYLQHGTWKTGFFLDNIVQGGWQDVRIVSRCPRHGLLFDAEIFMGTPAEILQAYGKQTGKPALPPQWAFGPWMSSNGWNTQSEALEQVDYMNRLVIPATVLVLEAWSDEETFYIWNDAKYTPRADGSPFTYEDFTFSPDGKWPDPRKFTGLLHENGLELILWQIPVVKYEAAAHGEQLDLDTKYAVDNGLCILNEDGSPYRITEMWFGNSLMPDFTNEETCRWWFDKRRYLVTELGVAGFKTDGGEFLFDERSLLHDGRRVEEAHNDYPVLYEKAYHDFMNQTMGPGKGITFSRAGYTGAQRCPIHWAGDQTSTFSELKAQLKAGLSLGLSGVPFWGFDIGGFAGDFPTTELYLRSAAFAAFAPVMQFHSEPRYGQYYMTQRNHWNNDRSPWNMAAANQDDTIIDIYRQYASLRMNLLPYLWREAKHCVQAYRPMMAHLIYDYPKCSEVLEIEDEYMLGRDLLVAPVITEGAKGRDIWLPPGHWYDFWSGERYTGNGMLFYACDYDKIPVFVREGGILPLNINHSLVMGGIGKKAAISNNYRQYERLCFFIYGGDKLDFSDASGTDIRISITEEQCVIDGAFPSGLTIVRMDGKEIKQYIVNGRIASVRPEPVTVFGTERVGHRMI